MDLEEQHRPLVVHNEANHRFEVALRDEWAFLEYRVDNDRIALFHTEVPAQFQNQGIGNDLVTAAMLYARRSGLKVLPECPFVTDFLNKNPEYNELVDPHYLSEGRISQSA
jgi:predicted GNAT family acetyltransferase